MFQELRRPRAFYARLFRLTGPIALQNLITFSLGLIDTFMVSRLGNTPMAAVTTANVPVFLLISLVFGIQSGLGILASQYWGKGDTESISRAIGVASFIGTGLSLLLAVALWLWPVAIMDLLSNEHELSVLGAPYLQIIGFSYVFNMLSSIYVSVQRSVENPNFGMKLFGFSTVLNTGLNYLLIYGKLGFPQLGVQGAAIATVLSRYVELGIIVIYTHSHAKKHPFARGLFRTLSIPRQVVKEITIKGMPLLVNELLWSLGMATLNQIYSLRGLDVVAATSISTTVFNLFSVFFFSMGTAASIIVGQDLGADEVEVAKDHAWKLIAFSVAISVVVGLTLISCSHAIPLLYDVLPSVRSLASQLILVCACMMPANAFCNCEYFIIRSGGKTGITFLFDCGFTWVLCIPLAYCLTHFTAMSVVLIFLCERFLDVIKGVIGLVLVKKGVWIHNIVSGKEMQVN